MHGKNQDGVNLFLQYFYIFTIKPQNIKLLPKKNL